jgi:hypothetical protein
MMTEISGQHLDNILLYSSMFTDSHRKVYQLILTIQKQLGSASKLQIYGLSKDLLQQMDSEWVSSILRPSQAGTDRKRGRKMACREEAVKYATA